MACMAENQLDARVLGVSWDGTGLGLDGTIWGGEFLAVDEGAFERVATFRRFPLPGGEQAIKEPRRSALGLLFEAFGSRVFEEPGLLPEMTFSASELDVLARMLEKSVNCPLTSSVGRLFDAVASILGIRQRVTFEGQAAMELEFAIAADRSDEAYPFAITGALPPRDDSDGAIQSSSAEDRSAPLVVDWLGTITGILEDVRRSVSLSQISLKFHNTLAEAVVEVAHRVGRRQVALSGGCFQNKYLTERVIQRLESTGFRPYWHQRVPPNDGGISLGQVFAAARKKGLQKVSKGAMVQEAVR